jgi:hypothetical protein
VGFGVPDGAGVGWPGAGGVLDVGDTDEEGWLDAGRVGDAGDLDEGAGVGE